MEVELSIPLYGIPPTTPYRRKAIKTSFYSLIWDWWGYRGRGTRGSTPLSIPLYGIKFVRVYGMSDDLATFYSLIWD